LNPTGDEGEESTSQSTLSTPSPAPQSAPAAAPIKNEAFAATPAVEERKKMDDVASAFDDLFNN
jgi:hypothetical protein